MLFVINSDLSFANGLSASEILDCIAALLDVLLTFCDMNICANQFCPFVLLYNWYVLQALNVRYCHALLDSAKIKSFKQIFYSKYFKLQCSNTRI